ncbi:NADH-quinone oxidoreductase subunit NuoK [Candidatus Providencia siddallii]|uniref:NADH-quinone oxidoreductase subunit K n=1 Tax=Candidatus Providencia siddallii TaxID=1715285 RepID=A0ABM9NNP6_9GAMM
MVPIQHGLILSSILFVIGLNCLVIRRNFLFMLLGLEIIINSIALAFVVVGNFWQQSDGQIMYILIVSLGAAESSVGLALLLRFYRRYQSLNVDNLSEMHEWVYYI